MKCGLKCYLHERIPSSFLKAQPKSPQEITGGLKSHSSNYETKSGIMAKIHYWDLRAEMKVKQQSSNCYYFKEPTE